MALILYERQKFVVFLAFSFTKIHWVVPDIYIFGYITCKYFRMLQLLFSGQLSGVKYQEFLRFSKIVSPTKFTVLVFCFDCFRAEIRLSFDV